MPEEKRREPWAWPTWNLVPLARTLLTPSIASLQGNDTEQKIKLIIILWCCSTLTIIALGIFQKSHDMVVTSWRWYVMLPVCSSLLQNVRRQKRETSLNWSRSDVRRISYECNNYGNLWLRSVLKYLQKV